MNNRFVQFGAGKIGRSFVGQLFSRAGFEVVFVDVSLPLVRELNRKKEYRIIIRGEKTEEITIRNIRALHVDEKAAVIHELALCRLMGLSVGPENMASAAALIAEGLLGRQAANPDKPPLDIIIAENMRNAGRFLAGELKKHLPVHFPLEEMTGLVETGIGKMVPIMTEKDLGKDPLLIFAERYNTLIVDKKAFRNPLPVVNGLAPRENMKAWVDRKSFIHNLGHAVAAYTGYINNPGHVYLYEVLSDNRVYRITRDTMMESARILMALHPGEFTLRDMTLHVDDLLDRFKNRALGDTVFRVGCDLPRKLGPDDRLAGAIRAGLKTGKPWDRILRALIRGYYFRARDPHGNFHPNDKAFIKNFKNDTGYLLQKVSGFDPDKDAEVFREARQINNHYKHTT